MTQAAQPEPQPQFVEPSTDWGSFALLFLAIGFFSAWALNCAFSHGCNQWCLGNGAPAGLVPPWGPSWECHCAERHGGLP